MVEGLTPNRDEASRTSTLFLTFFLSLEARIWKRRSSEVGVVEAIMELMRALLWIDYLEGSAFSIAVNRVRA
jgi:hypothetical protein